MLIAARNKTHIQKLKAQLKKEFDMKDLREDKKILGMEITRDRDSGRLWLSQAYSYRMLTLPPPSTKIFDIRRHLICIAATKVLLCGKCTV